MSGGARDERGVMELVGMRWRMLLTFRITYTRMRGVDEWCGG